MGGCMVGPYKFEKKVSPARPIQNYWGLAFNLYTQVVHKEGEDMF